jgi:predicted amidohydrolase
VVRTPFGSIAIVICYDVEFPLIARRLVERGAEIILVPSCTDTLAGHHRVTIGARARALENQCYVVQSATVGMAPWSLALDENHGVAAAFSPVDRGFPDDGVIVQGELDGPGWVYADLDVAALARARRDGQVRNFADFSLPAHLTGEVREVDWSAA